MAHEWITAETALRFLTDETYSYAEQRAICERAHGGMIAAKAELLLWNGEQHKQQMIPKQFWWAEGHEALEQDWSTGDFSTWIDETIAVKAFGVSFDFLGISELASAERRAIGMKRISVSSDEEWISAADLQRLVYSQAAISKAGALIIEACVMGQLVARAVRVSGVVGGTSRTSQKREWVAREWDVPLWFWRDFMKSESSKRDWTLGKARGKGKRGAAWETIEIQGLHFHRSGLPSLGLPENVGSDQSSGGAKRGRRPTYDWPAASTAIWGRIYRGELIPEHQAEIERAFQAHLARGDKEPSESTVRPYAKSIWDEFTKA